MNETTGDRRRWGRARPMQTGVLAVTAGLMLLTVACGSSPSTSSSSSASVSAGVAFARCVRAHGVPDYPDPNSNGQEPPNTKDLASSNPRFLSASSACAHVIPNGGQATSAPVLAEQRNAAKFAVCMRSHGLPKWPDATDNSDGQPIFNPQAVGINPHTPQVTSIGHSCQSLLHLTQLPEVAS